MKTLFLSAGALSHARRRYPAALEAESKVCALDALDVELDAAAAGDRSLCVVADPQQITDRLARSLARAIAKHGARIGGNGSPGASR